MSSAHKFSFPLRGAINGIFGNLKGGGASGYMSSIHFKNCSNFSIIIFHIKISTNVFFSPPGGQAQWPPKYAPGCYIYNFLCKVVVM